MPRLRERRHGRTRWWRLTERNEHVRQFVATKRDDVGRQNLASTTKSRPKMTSITPRLLLSQLPWVQVDGGIYRVNRTKVELPKAERIEVDLSGGPAPFRRSRCATCRCSPDCRRPSSPAWPAASERKQVPLGNKVIVEGEDGEQVLHHRPRAGRGPLQGGARQRHPHRPADRWRVLRRDRIRLRPGCGRDRADAHALHASEPFAQGP